jgi:hypothetical protein
LKICSIHLWGYSSNPVARLFSRRFAHFRRVLAGF